MCVLTTVEGVGISDMAAGIVRRYSLADEPPPLLLYVDSDCCSAQGGSKVLQMFAPWDKLQVRLDIWHFMRRFASCCTPDAYQLYGVFMAKLSAFIFKWDGDDLKALYTSKRAELSKYGVVGLSEQDFAGRVTRRELALHCRRTTRGVEDTTRLIDHVIQTLDSSQGRDTMGVLLFNYECTQQMWKEQRRHVTCIQDVAEIPLYTKTGSLMKGGVELPTYRCARGSTSLESFHNHLARFIPG